MENKESRLPFGFRIKDGFLECGEQASPDTDPIWRRIASEVHITAEFRNFEGNNWGKVLEFEDPDGTLKKILIPAHMFSGIGNEIRSKLLDEGLKIFPGNRNHLAFANYLVLANPLKKVRCVDRVGWHLGSEAPTFVLPKRSFGNQEILFHTEFQTKTSFETKGTLEGWKDSIAAYAAGNSRLVFALAAAFAAPCLRIVGFEGGGFHFRGPSSIGKTTILQVAGSVYGGGKASGNISTWRSTSNALEGVALSHCDSLLCLDEINQMGPYEIGQAVYMLANGAAKGRMRQDASLKRQNEWLLLFLSSGEQSLSGLLNSVQRSPLAGQEVRIVDLSADSGKELGIFETIHSLPSAQKLADHLKKSIKHNYGVAGQMFIEKLMDLRIDEARGILTSHITDYSSKLKNLSLNDVDGQVMRVAQRFAIVAAAGKLAIDLNILPDTLDVFGACETLFTDWCKSRGTVGSHEEREILNQLRSHIERFESKFRYMGQDPGSYIPDCHGYRSNDVHDPIGWYIFPDVFRKEIFSGVDYKEAQRILAKAAHLIHDKDESRYTKKVMIKGFDKAKPMYCVTKDFFFSDS